MSESTIVLAQLEVEECAAELYLNGVPVTRIAPPKVTIENVAVEQLLVPGSNRLEILVEPGSTPRVARDEYKELSYRPMRATGRLIRFREGAPGLASEGQILAEVSFAWENGKPERQAFPIGRSTSIEMYSAHGKWAWQDAPVLTLDQALMDEACALLDRVESVIRAGDEEAFWNLTELQVRDVLRAYPAVTEPYLRSELSSLMGHYRKTKTPVLPRDRATHDFRLVGGGRLLELVDRDYTTSFKLSDPGDGSAVPYRITVARIEGTLRIVR